MKHSNEDIKYIKEKIIDEVAKNFKMSEEERLKQAKIFLDFLDEYWTLDKNGRPVPKCKFKLNEKLKQINKNVGFEMNEVF